MSSVCADTRSALVVITAAPENYALADEIAVRLRASGFDTWTEGDIPVGSSRIAEYDAVLATAVAMILLPSSTEHHKDWADRQELAFRAKIRRSGDLKLIVLPKASTIVDVSAYAHSVVLPAHLNTEAAAGLCAAIIRHNRGLSSLRGNWPPDNRNAPLLSAGAWPLSPDMNCLSEQGLQRIFVPQPHDSYDELLELYWTHLRRSGFRDEWVPRLKASGIIYRMAGCNGDPESEGMILCKGIAYAQMTQHQYSKAERTLRVAEGLFNRARNRRGQGFCWSYLGDIRAQQGRIAEACSAYQAAQHDLSGLEQYEVVLKEEMLSLLWSNAYTIPRVKQIHRLRDDFAGVQSYREALMDMTLARTLSGVGEWDEAACHGQKAVRLLRDVIVMPRNARVAEVIHASTLARVPCPETLSGW